MAPFSEWLCRPRSSRMVCWLSKSMPQRKGRRLGQETAMGQQQGGRAPREVACEADAGQRAGFVALETFMGCEGFDQVGGVRPRNLGGGLKHPLARLDGNREVQGAAGLIKEPDDLGPSRARALIVDTPCTLDRWRSSNATRWPPAIVASSSLRSFPRAWACCLGVAARSNAARVRQDRDVIGRLDPVSNDSVGMYL